MKLALLLVTAAGLVILLVVFSTRDTRISERPVEIAEARASQTIKEAGSDPSTWTVEGDCVAMGPCRVDLGAPELPGLTLASDSYTVKDSRASVNGPENIGAMVERAVSRDCFERFTGKELRACLISEAQIPEPDPGA